MPDVHLSLLPNQHRFVMDASRYPAYIGGIGAGKTYAGAVKTIMRVQRKGYGMIAAPTYPMLRDSTRRTMTDMLDSIGLGYELHKGDNAITVETGHEIICRSLDNPETLRGPNLEWVWIDEAGLVSDMAWRIVKGRVRAGSHPQAWITTTPKGRNWIWREWVSETDERHTLYRTRTTENKHLPDGFADGLGYSGRFAEQELGGEFVAFEGVVYAGFNRADHVTSDVDTEGWATTLAVDVGHRNPTAILTIRRASDERRHVAREVYRRGMSSDEILDAIASEADDSNPDVIYLDPSAADYIAALQRRGYPAVKANNDVTYGIGVVTTAMANGLTIDPACVNLINELETYHYPDNRQESDKPVKEIDHACDALRYGLASEPALMTGELVAWA